MIYSGDPAFITGRALIRTANMHNQVGMKVWSAGLFLAELLLAVPHLIAERHVVELGAGTGCTGLIAALSSPSPLSVTMTDFHGDVLENLQHNIDMNRKCNNKMCELYCQQLDWMQCYRSEITSSEVFSSLGLAHGTAPVVLAADCCYAEDLCGILLHVVSLLLQSSSDRTESRSDDKPAVGLIATMVRNPDTYAHFEKCLATEENLCHRDITEWALAATELGGGYNGHFQPMFYYDGRDAIKLVCVAMKSEDIDNFLGTL
ncbi:unnamed protein product [Symbiodinium microadriaticum]|nr:unnamed protein product [Symbiodinium microadriaticum]